jgi:hypothetical protein
MTAGPTNDLGEYRFWGFPSGSYHVRMAGRQGGASAVGFTPGFSESREAFPVLYYPSAQNRQAAQPLKVGAGETVRTDFSADAIQAFQIRGIFGGIPSNSNVRLRLLKGEEAVANRVSVDLASGKFLIADVTPGSYTVQAFASGGLVYLAETSVIVGNQDVEGVNLALSTGVAVRGKVEIIGDAGASAPSEPVQTPGRRGIRIPNADDGDSDNTPGQAPSGVFSINFSVSM